MNIDLPENVKVDEIQIVDVMGRVLQTLDYSNSFSVDLPKGTYFLRLLNRTDIVATQKIILD